MTTARSRRWPPSRRSGRRRLEVHRAGEPAVPGACSPGGVESLHPVARQLGRSRADPLGRRRSAKGSAGPALRIQQVQDVSVGSPRGRHRTIRLLPKSLRKKPRPGPTSMSEANVVRIRAVSASARSSRSSTGESRSSGGSRPSRPRPVERPAGRELEGPTRAGRRWPCSSAPKTTAGVGRALARLDEPDDSPVELEVDGLGAELTVVRRSATGSSFPRPAGRSGRWRGSRNHDGSVRPVSLSDPGDRTRSPRWREGRSDRDRRGGRGRGGGGRLSPGPAGAESTQHGGPSAVRALNIGR